MENQNSGSDTSRGNPGTSGTKIDKLNAWLNETLKSTDENGNPDINRIIYNSAYNMGEAAVTLSGVIMKEEVRKARIMDELRVLKAKTYEQTIRDKSAYDPSAEGLRTLVDGDPVLSTKMRELDKCTAYIDGLKRCMDLIKWYPRNASAIQGVAEYGITHGTFLPDRNFARPLNIPRESMTAL